jgi:Holliday junction resolvasome RuvABC DNA-binding subunit
MIAAIHGDVVSYANGRAIIMTASGVGYEVLVGDDFTGETNVTVYCRHTYNDNTSRDVLFGFSSITSRALADLIEQKTDKVGYTIAHRIVTSVTLNELRAALEQDNPQIISSKVKGLGAEKARSVLGTIRESGLLGRLGVDTAAADPRIKSVLATFDAMHLTTVQYERARVSLVRLAALNHATPAPELFRAAICELDDGKTADMPPLKFN